MSKLAHSHQPSMDKIEADAREREERGERTDPPMMNGLCKTLDAYYGTQPTDDSKTEWHAIKVERDGNVQILAGPFSSEDEAEMAAGAEHQLDLQAHSQFGAGA